MAAMKGSRSASTLWPPITCPLAGAAKAVKRQKAISVFIPTSAGMIGASPDPAKDSARPLAGRVEVAGGGRIGRRSLAPLAIVGRWILAFQPRIAGRLGFGLVGPRGSRSLVDRVAAAGSGH